MTRLEDLPEECLLIVLGKLRLKELFRMLRVNKQMNRLVTDEMRNNVKSIALDHLFGLCHKHGSARLNQLLFFSSPQLQKDAFLSVLSKCAGAKSVDFSYSELPYYLLFEVFRRCPQLECFKMSASAITKKGWRRVLSRFGKRIVHFNKCWYDEPPESTRLLKIFAANCPNIKEINWIMNNRLTGDFVEALKMLPKNCWFSLLCDSLPEEGFTDVVDVLQLCKVLDWSLLGQRIERLSWIRFLALNPGDGPVCKVDFAGLKNFDASECGIYNHQLVNCITASRFPQLEEFGFRTNLIEDEYSTVFKQMPTVKKLTIIISNYSIRQGGVEQLPQTTSINQLKNLEAINLEFRCLQNNWQTKGFIQQLEQYVEEIKSLKKLTVVLGRERPECEWQKNVTREINRLKLKQTRVQISFSDKNYITYKNKVLISERKPFKIA